MLRSRVENLAYKCQVLSAGMEPTLGQWLLDSSCIIKVQLHLSLRSSHNKTVSGTILIDKIFNRLPYATCFTAVTVTKCQNEAFGSGSAYDLLNSSNCHKMMQSRSPADFFTIGFKAFSVVKCCNTVLGTAIFYDLFCSRNCHKISQCGSCVALFRTYYVRGTVAKCCNAAFKADSAL